MRLISSKVAVWAMAAAALAALPAWADPKIGIVDAQRLLEESPQGKAVQEAMRNEFAPRQRTLQAQEQTLKAKLEKLQKDGATMSEDQRQRAEKELRDGQRDFERARGEFQDDISARRNEEMSRLQRTLGEEVRTYAKANNYDIVLSGEVVVFASQTFDITPGVLAAMQAHGGGAAAKPAGTPSPTPTPMPKPTK
jgi:outer membrane protein